MIDVGEVIVDLAVDPALERRGGLSQPRGVEMQHERQHGRAFGEVQPLHIGLVFGISGRRAEAALAIYADKIIHDGAGFGDGDSAIGNNRRLAQRVYCLQLRRREARGGVALIEFDVIRDVQLFKQPENPLRAGIIQVMDDDHGQFPRGGLLASVAAGRVNA